MDTNLVLKSLGHTPCLVSGGMHQDSKARGWLGLRPFIYHLVHCKLFGSW